MPNAVGLGWCFAAALAFGALCLGVALAQWATRRQARRAAEKHRLDAETYYGRLLARGRLVVTLEAERDALRRELDALKKARAAA